MKIVAAQGPQKMQYGGLVVVGFSFRVAQVDYAVSKMQHYRTLQRMGGIIRPPGLVLSFIQIS